LRVNIFMARRLAREDRELVRYLLGLLPDKDAERIDEQSIADDEVAARLRAVENDLVDAYVSGTLDGEFLERFESFYLASPRRRDKVKFARQFISAIDRMPAAATATPRAVVTRAHFVWLTSAAMLLVACGVLSLQDIRLRRGLLDAQHNGAVLDNRARDLARQLGEQRAANDAMRKELDRFRATQPIALALRPQTRAAAPTSLIVVPPGLDVVAFNLELEASDFPQYQVALKDPATNHVMWRSGIVTPASSRHTPAVVVDVPASLLKPQHYSLELSGRKPGEPFDVVGSYAFQTEER
jgi:hypothetical protein